MAVLFAGANAACAGYAQINLSDASLSRQNPAPIVRPASTVGTGTPTVGGQNWLRQDAAVAAQPAPVAAPVASPAVGQSWTSGGCESCGTGGCDDCQVGFGLLRPSEGCFDCFISPISNPVFFEDPRNLTEARFIFLNHQVPTAAGGGNVQLYALQLRAALSKNVSLIATKDGFVTSSNPLIDDGWADLSAGLKFNLLRDPQAQRLLSSGFTFEMPTGMARTLQGNGDGELNLFLTGGQRFGGRNQVLSAAGYRIPMNSTDESQVFYWSNHLSRQLTGRMYALTEFNWYHWVQSGQDGLAGVEGLDLFNLGSTGVTGNDIVTQAVGLKFKPHNRSEVGFAYEFPLTERRDIIEDRVNINWIWRY